MKSLVKLALIALIYAIVMGLTSCRGCSDADALSFSTANSDEVEVVTESSSESVMSDPSDETTPSSSFSQATENNQTMLMYGKEASNRKQSNNNHGNY